MTSIILCRGPFNYIVYKIVDTSWDQIFLLGFLTFKCHWCQWQNTKKLVNIITQSMVS